MPIQWIVQLFFFIPKHRSLFLEPTYSFKGVRFSRKRLTESTKRVIFLNSSKMQFHAKTHSLPLFTVCGVISCWILSFWVTHLAITSDLVLCLSDSLLLCYGVVKWKEPGYRGKCLIDFSHWQYYMTDSWSDLDGDKIHFDKKPVDIENMRRSWLWLLRLFQWETSNHLTLNSPRCY